MRLEDEPPNLCSISSEQGRFEPAPYSWVGGLAPLGSWGATAEPPTSAGTSGATVELSASVVSWGRPTFRPVSAGLVDALSPRGTERPLHRRVYTYQRILARQVIPLSVGNYLGILLVVVIIIITVCLLPALPRTYLLLLLPPLVLLRLPLLLGHGAVGRRHGRVLR